MVYLHKAKSMKGLATRLLNIYAISESSRIALININQVDSEHAKKHNNLLTEELKHYRKQLRILSRKK